MKIAILTPTFSHYSGIDRVAEQQAIEYSRKGHDVSVFALEASIKPKGYRLEVLGMPKSMALQRLHRLLFFLDIKKVNNAAKNLKDYDLVISHFYPMNLIAAKARRKYGTKYVYHNHGISYTRLFSSPAEKIYMILFRLFNNLSLRNTDSAVSVSKFLKDELKKETGIESRVEYNRIDSRYKKGINGNKIRKKLGIKSSEKLLFFIGRLSPHKNIHTLLKIFGIVNKKMPSTKLLIAGRPTFKKYHKQLKQMAGKNVIFMSSVDDKELPNYYAACDLYVTASLWEGFNLPIAEAQACGKKVVAFDVCSHPEVVKSGMLVKKDDVNSFADAIIKCLK